jgi:hypothetical protein
MLGSSCAIALALGVGLTAQSQTTTTKTETKGAQPQTMTFAGCVGGGTQTSTYILNKVAPVTRTTETPGALGPTTTTVTSYELVPDERVEIKTHLGRKVEVTGTMIPAGDSKTKTTTKVERDDAPDSKVTETRKTDNDRPQFRVTSIRDTGERCDGE